MLKVFIDADSCPVSIREYVQKICFKKNIPILFVANKHIQHNDFVKMIICSDITADEYILNNSDINSIIVTRDIILSQELLKKNVRVINIYGEKIDSYILKDKLLQREISLNLQKKNIIFQSSKKYSDINLTNFINTFNKEIQCLKK